MTFSKILFHFNIVSHSRSKLRICNDGLKCWILLTTSESIFSPNIANLICLNCCLPIIPKSIEQLAYLIIFNRAYFSKPQALTKMATSSQAFRRSTRWRIEFPCVSKASPAALTGRSKECPQNPASPLDRPQILP